MLDVQLGAESGVDLARALRAIAQTLPIVFMTGEPASPEAARARTLSPLAVLAKPFPAETLTDLIRGATKG